MARGVRRRGEQVDVCLARIGWGIQPKKKKLDLCAPLREDGTVRVKSCSDKHGKRKAANSFAFNLLYPFSKSTSIAKKPFFPFVFFILWITSYAITTLSEPCLPQTNLHWFGATNLAIIAFNLLHMIFEIILKITLQRLIGLNCFTFSGSLTFEISTSKVWFTSSIFSAFALHKLPNQLDNGLFDFIPLTVEENHSFNLSTLGTLNAPMLKISELEKGLLILSISCSSIRAWVRSSAQEPLVLIPFICCLCLLSCGCHVLAFFFIHM